MARINIEDCWWIDPRREQLGGLVGDIALADGLAIRAWRIAQEYWKHGDLIPEHVFNSLKGATHLLGVCLAEVRESPNGKGIYVRGSSERLEWLREKKKNGSKGGKKSAARPRDAKGRMQKQSKQDPSNLQAEAKQDPSESKPLTLIPLLVPTQVQEELRTKGENGELLPARSGTGALTKGGKKSRYSDEHNLKASEFVGAYVRAYQTRFPGKRPEDLNDGATKGQIMNWVKDYPLDRAKQLIQVYFQLEGKWFNTKGYDFATFRNNLNKIGQALDSGKDPDGNTVDWASVHGGAT